MDADANAEGSTTALHEHCSGKLKMEYLRGQLVNTLLVLTQSIATIKIVGNFCCVLVDNIIYETLNIRYLLKLICANQICYNIEIFKTGFYLLEIH